MARLAEATGRTVVYNNLSQTVRNPDKWKQHMARVDETVAKGIKALDDIDGAEGAERIYGGYFRNAHLWDLE